MGHERQRPGYAGGLYVSWHRCVVDGYDHAVTDEQFAAGRSERLGRYESVCGHVVDVAPMLWSPGEPCTRCLLYLEARDGLRTVARRMPPRRHRKPGLWRRLFSRSEAPAIPVPRRSEGAASPDRGGRSGRPAGTGSTSVSAGRHHWRGGR
ncbi:hypothetical protein [Amycolatopsis sp. YIM 10]|uniref:hypothetical protein n=1 Tax=Amycolatopsis sp. YIM 10 TaxID=2653857 RepID=UPI00128FE97E|nr:hypothetical protein [Amycolatopsis sp. YIM 10]